MQSGACAGKIEKLLYGIDGVQSAAVSLSLEGAEIIYDPARTTAAKLANAVAEAGYAARLPAGTPTTEYSAPASPRHINSGCG